jgi:hypothetical protein
MLAGKIVLEALISSTTLAQKIGRRVYAQVIPQESPTPAIAYDVQVNSPVEGSAPMLSATVTVGCWARVNAEAHEVAKLVRQLLSGYFGEAEGTRLAYLEFAGQTESYDVEFDLRGVVLTFSSTIVQGD